MPEFQAAYERILEATGLRTQSEVAVLLGIQQSSISDAKRRKSIPDQWLLTLFDKHSLNPGWLRTREGPRYLTGSDGQPPLPIESERRTALRLEPVLKSALLATVPVLAEELRKVLESSSTAME